MTQVCMFCGVKMVTTSSTPNAMYGADEPRGTMTVPFGSHCPKCRRGNCGVSVDEDGKVVLSERDRKQLTNWFTNVNPEDLDKVIPGLKSELKCGEGA